MQLLLSDWCNAVFLAGVREVPCQRDRCHVGVHRGTARSVDRGAQTDLLGHTVTHNQLDSSYGALLALETTVPLITSVCHENSGEDQPLDIYMHRGHSAGSGSCHGFPTPG